MVHFHLFLVLNLPAQDVTLLMKPAPMILSISFIAVKVIGYLLSVCMYIYTHIYIYTHVRTRALYIYIYLVYSLKGVHFNYFHLHLPGLLLTGQVS